MSDAIIEVQNLGKEYRIGKSEPYRTLRESVVNLVKAPLRKLRDVSNGDAKPTIWALKDVSFDVAPGEVVGIIGRNGAGKSTLLKILSRITKPTSGRIVLGGRIGSLLEVGTGFHPELTGRENIYLNGAILGMRKAEIRSKFDEIVAFSEIEQFLDTPVKRYSSGMYMRLAFAVAAHLDPEILIVDEVLAVGDVAFQKKCLGKMKQVGQSGRTVLFVSHNMNAVEELCDTVILLEQGQVRERSKNVRQTIHHYLFAEDAAGAASEWRNPGNLIENPWFQPLRFALTDESGKRHQMPVRNDSRVFVEIEGIIKEREPAMNVGYAILNEEGHLLYWSLTTDAPEEKWPKYEIGKCMVRSQIPTRFLNEGDYRLEMIASLHHRAWITEPGVNAPSVHLSIRGGLSDSPYWLVARPGSLAPELSWTVQPA